MNSTTIAEIIEAVAAFQATATDSEVLCNLTDAQDALECAGDRLNEIEDEEDARASADPSDDGDRAYDAWVDNLLTG